MVVPGAGFHGVALFRSKNRQRQKKKKSLRHKIGAFSVQMRLEIKQNEKTRSSPQIIGIMV